MIKTIVIEKELHSLKMIKQFVRRNRFMMLEKEYSTPMDALEKRLSTLPEAAFIELPLTGMAVTDYVKKLSSLYPEIKIIFLSQCEEYAIQAFELDVLDYIIIPLTYERFKITADRLKNTINKECRNQKPEIKIKCFERLSISINDNPVRWSRAKSEELFAYLLINRGKYISKYRIIEDLWPNYEVKNALKILQTTVGDIRKAFANVNNVILDYSNEQYSLLLSNIKCDYFEALHALGLYKPKIKATYCELIKNCSTVSKGLLAQQGYIWCEVNDQALLNRYIKALKEIISDYSADGNDVEMIKVLKCLAKIRPDDMKVNGIILNKLRELGRYSEISNHRQWLQRVLKDEYVLQIY